MDGYHNPIKIALSLILSLILAACGGGGGGGSDTPTPADPPAPQQGSSDAGVLFDARLANVPYTSPSYSGVTDSLGQFDFKAGETVVFSLGNYSFDAVSATNYISVVDLLQADEIDQEVVNLARLLQSIDNNPSNNVITIPDLNDVDLSGLDLTHSGENFEANATVQAVLSQYGNQPNPTQLISEQQAVEHLYDSASSLNIQLPAIAKGLDNDGDGQLNSNDSDDDNDGVVDAEDDFPLDSSESLDTDGDGVGDNKDADDDNDGILDDDDMLPVDDTETGDNDGDGIGDIADTDDDNDGVADFIDWAPLNPDESVDTDGDGIGNNEDLDDDNDGVSDSSDTQLNLSSLSIDATDMVRDETNQRLYISSWDAKKVYIIDLLTGDVVNQLSFDYMPGHMFLRGAERSPRGGYAG